MSDSLWSQGLQHARFLCLSLYPGVYSNSCPLSQWYHLIASSCHPLLLLSLVFPSIRVFPNESALCIVPKVLELQFQHQSFQWIFSVDFLNVYIQPKWTCKLSPDVMVVGVAGLWEVIRSQEQSPHELYTHHYKKTSESYLLCSALQGHTARRQMSVNQKRGSHTTESAGALICHYPVSRTIRNMLFISHSAHDILIIADWMDEDSIPHRWVNS